jgi:hypothetical protein
MSGTVRGKAVPIRECTRPPDPRTSRGAELCEQLRLQSRRLTEYRKRLLAEMKPLGSTST